MLTRAFIFLGGVRRIKLIALPHPANTNHRVCLGNFKMTCIDIKLASSAKCFPGTATVSTRRGALPLSELRIGDEVLDEGNQWTTVLGWLHRDVDMHYLARRINSRLLVSLRHLVKLQDNSFIQARLLKVGTALRNNETVRSLETEIATSAYAPYTASGTLLVDGFLVSCYAHVSSHWWAHAYVSTLFKIGLWNGNGLSSWLVFPFRTLDRWLE